MEKVCIKLLKSHNFSDFLYLGKSEIKTGGNLRMAVLEDSVEAVIAAIYMDGGLKEAEKIYNRKFKKMQ